MTDYIMPVYGGGSPVPPATGWRCIARHKCAVNALISESAAIDESGRFWRRFTATVCGYRGFRLYAGVVYDETVGGVIERPGGLIAVAMAMATAIRDDIERFGEAASCLTDGALAYTKWSVVPYRGWE